MSKKSRIALMCFENDPNYCHRSILANKLRREGVEVDIE